MQIRYLANNLWKGGLGRHKWARPPDWQAVPDEVVRGMSDQLIE